MFYNTIHLPKDLLAKELIKTKKTKEKILAVFRVSLDIGLTPAEVFDALDQVYPLTSIRRCITNLTQNDKVLVKTHKQRPGFYVTPNYIWKLK